MGFSIVARRCGVAANSNAIPFVDMHTHLGQEWGARAPLSVSDLLHWMDARGIEAAVVLPLVSPEAYDYPVSVDYVLKQTKPHRDRLIPFCVVDPRTLDLSAEGKRDLLRRYKDAGARGFGEHKPGVAIDDPRNLALYEACAELQLPVLFHMDNQRNWDKPGLPGLEKVLKAFPTLTFIGHAPGWWANISGDCTQEDMDGYPNRPVTPGGAIDRLMDQYPNLYADLSAESGANALRRDLTFAAGFLERRQDRICFGTDYLAKGQEVPQFEILAVLSPHLSDAARRKICRDNACSLLHIRGG